MSVTLNQGLRNYQESVTHKIGSLNVTINLCPSASNILIQIPTFNTIGVHIMSPIIIYNYQLRSSGGVFRGAKLNYFPTLYKNGNDFYIHNPDGMIDHYSGYNNVNPETESYVYYSYAGRDLYILKDKYDNMIEYLSYNNSLPNRIIYKNGTTFTITSSSNIPMKIDNVCGDEIYFSYNGSYITNLIYYKNNVIKYKTYLSYTNNKLSGVETKVVDNNIETTIEYYTITESTNSLVVKDEIMNHYFMYTFNNDHQVISILDSYNIYETNLGEAYHETTLAYSDTTTTVTDIFGKTTKYYFSNGIPTMIYDEIGQMHEKRYDYITKKIKEENKYPLLNPKPNLLPVNMNGFNISNPFSITPYSESDTNYDFITNKYKITGSYGDAYYAINTSGSYNDTIQFLFYIKVLSGGTSNYLHVQMMIGGTPTTRNIDLNYTEGYKLVSLELTAKKDFTHIYLDFIGYGIVAVVGGLSVIRNTGLKSYTYNDTNLTSFNSKYNKRDLEYDNNLVSSSVGTNLPATNYKYDNRNNITKEEKPYLLDVNNTYTPYNQISTKELIDKDSNKIKEECIYDNENRLVTRKDALYKETSYTYYSFNNVRTETSSLNQVITYSYDSKLNLSSITKDNKTINYSYNNNMISDITITNGNSYSFSYDAKEQLESVSINNTEIGSYSYDSYGRIVSSSNGFSFEYTMDKLTSVSYNNSTLYSIEYDLKNRIEEIKDSNDNTLEEYIYDDEDKLEEKNIRDLNARYDYSDSFVGDILYALGNHKEYHSYNSIQKSFNTSKEAILHQFEKECYVGEYRENYKLKYKKDLKLPNDTFTFERFEDNYIPYIKPGTNLSYTFNSDKIMIGFWFKQEESSFSHLLTINQDNVYIGVYLDLNNHLHLLVECEYDQDYNMNICTDTPINITSWNYFGLEYYDDGNEKKIIFELNDEIKMGTVEFSLVSPYTYHIGYKYYDNTKTEVFPGGISNLMIGKDILAEGYIYSYYLYTKNYIYNNQIENNQQIQYISTSSFRNVTGLNYDLIPLENNFKSNNGITPIRFDVNQDLFYDASKTFAYNSYYKRYCYLAYGNKLVYDFDFTNNGTVFLKGSILETKDKQYFITIKNEFGKSISVYRNQNKHIKLKYDYYEVDTGYTLNNGPFFVGVSYNEIVNNNTRVMAVFFGNNSSTCSFPLSNSFNHPKVYIGTDNDGNNALMGMIMDICYKKEYVTSIPSSISNLIEYHKNSYYDLFGRSNQVSIYKNNTELLRDIYSFKTRSNDNTYTSLLVNKETYKINNTNYERNYTLDNLGRVTSITDSTFGNHSYSYNALGYLSSDDNKSLTYDNNGNILSYGTNTYTYDNISRLVSYNNNPITYNTTHPFLMETFNGYTYTYQGKMLGTATKNNKTINFTYDLEGLIIKKEVVENNTTTTTNYYYDNRRLVKEVKGNDVISYFYDSNNQLYGYKENNTIYFYIRDVLGNIIGILSNSGSIVSKFDYDAFGNIINQTGTVISNFRYKGYYYDTDLELYYLKSRFYNPVLLRFITPDSIEYLDSSSIIGLNLYAYCGNDPINRVDENGNWWLLAFIIAVAVVATINDVCELTSGNVKATSTDGNVQIVNSSEIHTPWVRLGYSFYLNYINPDTCNVIQGTSFGMEFEWFAHNVAYTGLSILEYLGVNSIGKETIQDVKGKAQNVDLGPTIYNDNHNFASIAMDVMYFSLNPHYAWKDLYKWWCC